jgi:hypothetical protein
VSVACLKKYSFLSSKEVEMRIPNAFKEVAEGITEEEELEETGEVEGGSGSSINPLEPSFFTSDTVQEIEEEERVFVACRHGRGTGMPEEFK